MRRRRALREPRGLPPLQASQRKADGCNTRGRLHADPAFAGCITPLTERGHHETVDSRRYCDGCVVSSAPVFAGDVASVFDKWMDSAASECVPLSAIQSVSKVTDLTAEQFEFVRALYVAILPVSRTLPPGDHAVMASSDGSVMLVLVADGQARARFLAPDFIQAMLIQVGQRVTVGLGTPL